MIHTTLCYIEKDGCYLMLHRIKKKKDINRDKWIGIGGKLEGTETPEECIIREVREETGLTLTDYRCRGIVHFCPKREMEEMIYLYTAAGFEGQLNESCAEGVLEWIPKDMLFDLPLWEGDPVFLRLIQNQNQPFFYLVLDYENDKLTQVILDGKEM